MNVQQEMPVIGPSFVRVDGEVAIDGQAIALHLIREAQDPVHICLRVTDLQYLVSMLLWLGHEAKHRQPPAEADVRPSDVIYLPLSALNVGSDDRNDTFLTLEVGATNLMFRLLPKYLKELGETFLTLSANCSGSPS